MRHRFSGRPLRQLRVVQPEDIGKDEADPAKGSISDVSPLARVLLGKSVGDMVRAGKDEAEITAIE